MLGNFLTFLTLLQCSNTNILEDPYFVSYNTTTDRQYDVNSLVQNLNVEICVFIGVGLKYYAIFVEIADPQNGSGFQHYFLGICHASTLAMWKLCSAELAAQNRRKCRFQPNHSRHYHPRIHRRFCDFKYMQRNENCQCIPTMFASDLKKVIGMPTCYIPPLPASLCQYSVCGMSKCATTQDQNMFNVKCECPRPFCESQPQLGTSVRPLLRVIDRK